MYLWLVVLVVNLLAFDGRTQWFLIQVKILHHIDHFQAVLLFEGLYPAAGVIYYDVAIFGFGILRMPLGVDSPLFFIPNGLHAIYRIVMSRPDDIIRIWIGLSKGNGIICWDWILLNFTLKVHWGQTGFTFHFLHLFHLHPLFMLRLAMINEIVIRRLFRLIIHHCELIIFLIFTWQTLKRTYDLGRRLAIWLHQVIIDKIVFVFKWIISTLWGSLIIIWLFVITILTVFSAVVFSCSFVSLEDAHLFGIDIETLLKFFLKIYRTRPFLSMRVLSNLYSLMILVIFINLIDI